MASDKIFFNVFHIYAYVNNVPLELAIFWPPGHNLNKLGIGPLGDVTYQIPRTSGFRQEEFFMFSLYKPM